MKVTRNDDGRCTLTIHGRTHDLPGVYAADCPRGVIVRAARKKAREIEVARANQVRKHPKNLGADMFATKLEQAGL